MQARRALFGPHQQECRDLAIAIDRLIELDEQASAKQHERVALLSLMDAVIEALPDALIVTDAAGKIVLFNEKAEFMFGYHRSEMIGQPVELLMPERNRARHVHDRDIYNRFDISQRARTMGIGANLIGIRSDGHEFPADITLARMVAPTGVHNLALIRFSHQIAELAAAADAPGQAEPHRDIDDADAGH
jgi:PAS domain S-box-containing protein